MATVKIVENMFESTVNTFEAECNQTVEEIIRKQSDGTKYDDYLVECYDCETGETIYAPISDDNENLSVMVTVNGQSQDLNYIVEKNDVIEIVFLPLSSSNNWSWSNWNIIAAVIGGGLGALSGGITGAYFGGPIGALIGGVAGFVLGFVFGGFIGGNLINQNKSSSSETPLTGNSLPDTRGSSNQELTGNAFPFVLGKHLVTPFISGSSFNNLYGYYGQDNYITALYLVGNAPLKITELRLGDRVLAHNKRWSGNQTAQTVFHGQLSGIEEVPIDMNYYQENVSSPIDLKNRPIVTGSDLKAEGWDNTLNDEDLYTVYPQVYTNGSESFPAAIVVTPILQDGTILTPNQLQSRVNTIFATTVSGEGVLLYKISGRNCEKLAEDYAKELHKAQANYYFDENITGDIVSTWTDNEVKIDILQQGQNGEPVDYGELYPYAIKQKDVNASVLYIVDNPDEMKNASYKGLSLKNGMRNQPVIYTEQYPMSAKVELDFPSGVYKTYTHNDDGDSEVKYEQIPLWADIQWRVSSEDNQAPNAETHGIINGECNPSNPNYWRNQEKAVRGWHSFTQQPSSSFLWVEFLSSDSYEEECFTKLKIIRRPSGSIKGAKIYTEAKAEVDIGFKITNFINVRDTSSNNNPVDLARSIIKSKIHKTEVDSVHEIQLRVNFNYEWSYNPRDGEGGHKHYGYEHTWSKVISFTLNPGESEKIIEEHFNLSIAEGKDSEEEPVYLVYEPKKSIVIDEIYIDGKKVRDKDMDVNDYNSSFTEGLNMFYAAFMPNTINLIYNRVATYDAEARSEDISAHSNNVIPADINKDWLGVTAYNFEELAGTNNKQEGLNEIRFSAEVNFVSWARNNFKGQYSTEEEFIELFKEYFYPAANTTKSIEIRVVRLSPNYQNETSSNGDNSPATYNDIFTWKTLTSTMLDEKALEGGEIIQKRPLSEEDMRKYCLIAIRAKSDNVDQLTSTLKKFSCTAESFAPYFDTDERKWFPENVNQNYKYFAPNYQDNNNKWHKGEEITKQDYITQRQNGKKAIRAKNGNNFTKDLVTNVIRTQNNIVNGRYILRNNVADEYVNGWNLNPIRYLENNVASMILLAGIGSQAGINALSYADYDLISLAKMFEFCESVKDGSVYNSDGYHYDKEGNYVHHNKGDVVDMKFTANAYIYNAEKLEDIIAKLCIAGRSVVTRNRNNQLTFIVDKPEPYHVALINQANTISSSYSLKYDDNVAGFMINYPDENDGYNQNTLYAMKDAETVEDHRGNIEAYQFAYVTNPYQAWSLGRYLLANKVMNKEVVTKKIGMEGYSIGLGNIVCVQDDTMMIGTDFGGRITELIEDDDYIYGFLINNTYHFTDEREETDNDLVKKGVMVMQPSLSPYEQSRVVILRLAPAGTHKTITRYVDMGNGERTIRTEEFTVKKGQTNVVILKNKVSKHSNYVINDNDEEVDTFLVKPQVDNIIGFGDVNSISALYRVIGIKPDNKHNYELSLLKYQPELYEYGRELPSFQNNMTKRDYVDESYALTESATREDINDFVKNVLDITDTKIDERFDGLATSNIVTLYKRSATTPRLPSVNAYYDFSKPMTDASKLGFIQLWAGPFDTKVEAMVEGSVDKGSWTVSTEYDELDVVAEGGKYYRCTTEHTSSNVSFDNDFNGSAGWTLNIPDGSLPLYITVASATSNTSIATIESDDWSSPKLFTSSSTDRADVIWLYKRSVLEPTAPIESLVYDFENGVFKGDASTIATKLDGWVLGTDKDGMAGISDNFAVALWVTTAGAIGKTETTIDPSDWTKPLKLVSGAAFTHKIEANVDSVTSTIVPAEFIVHKRPEGVVYKIDNPMLAAAGNTLSLKVQKIVDEGGENETRYDITGYYIVEQLTKNYEVVAIGNLPANSTITFTMPSTDVRVKVYNESSKIQLLDIERINVLTDNKFTANVNDCYIQIPTNSNLFPVNSGSKEISIRAAYEDEILRYDDEDVYTNRYKIINVVVFHTAFTVRQTVSGGFVIEYNSSKAIPSGMQGLATIECYYGGYKNKVINIPFQVKAIDNGEVVPADSDRTEEVKAAYYKPDIDILNFSFLKSDDGIDYEEFDGYYKLWLSRKDGEWGFLPEGAEERVPDVVGSGTSLEYNLVENFIGDLSNPITAYRLDLYRDAEYTQLLDSETIPVLYDDEQIRIDMTNDNVSLVANSSGEVISYLPTASNIAVYKGKDKLEYSNTALTTLIQNLGDAKAQYYYNIEITPTNCTGQTITSTDPKNILLGSISAVTDVDLMFAYRTITIKYIMIGKKLVGFSGSGRNIKPKYQRTHKIEESSIVQAIAIVKNGETRKIKFAVGPFGLNTSSATDMSTLTWYDNMPVRTSSQCIYMAVENTTQSSN